MCGYMLCSLPQQVQDRGVTLWDISQLPLINFQEAPGSDGHYPAVATRGLIKTFHQEDTGSMGTSFCPLLQWILFPRLLWPLTGFAPPIVTLSLLLHGIYIWVIFSFLSIQQFYHIQIFLMPIFINPDIYGICLTLLVSSAFSNTCSSVIQYPTQHYTSAPFNGVSTASS